mgnify:CR=1 FL=1
MHKKSGCSNHVGLSILYWSTLKRISDKLTSLVIEALKELGAEPVSFVQISSLCKKEDEEASIWGEYIPQYKGIVLYLGCFGSGSDTRNALHTLLHELVHHLQYTRHNLVRVHLDEIEALKIDKALPWHARPHEVEAEELAEELARSLSPDAMEMMRRIIEVAASLKGDIRLELHSDLPHVIRGVKCITLAAREAGSEVVVWGEGERAVYSATVSPPELAELLPMTIALEEPAVLGLIDLALELKPNSKPWERELSWEYRVPDPNAWWPKLEKGEARVRVYYGMAKKWSKKAKLDLPSFCFTYYNLVKSSEKLGYRVEVEDGTLTLTSKVERKPEAPRREGLSILGTLLSFQAYYDKEGKFSEEGALNEYCCKVMEIWDKFLKEKFYEA